MDATPCNLVVTGVSDKPAAFTFRVSSYQTIRHHIQDYSQLVSRYLPVLDKKTMKYAFRVVSLWPGIWTRNLPNTMQECWCLPRLRIPHKRLSDFNLSIFFHLIRHPKFYTHTKHAQKTNLKISVERNVLRNVTSYLPVRTYADVSVEPAQYIPYDSTTDSKSHINICSKLKMATTIMQASLATNARGSGARAGLVHISAALRYHTERYK